MTLATVGRVTTPALPDLVDGLAARTGAWVLVERLGAVVCHGAGGSACPPALAQTLVGKHTRELRAAVRWSRSGRLVRGTVDGVGLVAAELGDGSTAWLIGGESKDLQDALPLLSAAAHVTCPPAHDSFVDELLHPRGVARRGQAPQALLLLLRADGPLATLSGAAVAAVAGTTARVHAEGDAVLVALAPDADATALLAILRRICPTVVGGLGLVDDDASDWVTAARLASGSLLAAQALGLSLGDPTDPAVAAELVVQEAQDAAAELLRLLPGTPLHRLQEHDARGSGELVASLAAWCRNGFDVPAAAADLHVHVNTLRYRLRRASEVSGLDLRRPRQLLALQLLLAV